MTRRVREELRRQRGVSPNLAEASTDLFQYPILSGKRQQICHFERGTSCCACRMTLYTDAARPCGAGFSIACKDIWAHREGFEHGAIAADHSQHVDGPQVQLRHELRGVPRVLRHVLHHCQPRSPEDGEHLRVVQLFRPARGASTRTQSLAAPQAGPAAWKMGGISSSYVYFGLQRASMRERPHARELQPCGFMAQGI